MSPRVYEVAPEDFPLKIEVEAVNLAANRAIVGELRLETGGEVVSTVRPELEEDQDNRTIRYRIERPASAATITQTIDGFFNAKAPDNARYAITITAATGDSQPVGIRVPTINPGTARLTFVFGGRHS